MGNESISIRCDSKNPSILWFHLENTVLLSHRLTIDHVRKQTLDLVAANHITPVGSRIAKAALNVIPADGYMNLSQKDFLVGIPTVSMMLWKELLPPIIEAIQQVPGLEKLEVRHEPCHTPGAYEWHLPMLRKLFGVDC